MNAIKRSNSRKHRMSAGRVLTVIMIALLQISGAVYADDSGNSPQMDITVVDPTCTEDGYTRYENLEDGSVTIRDEIPALGHQFGEWEYNKETGSAERTCTVCGTVETRDEGEKPDFPVVRLSGDMTGISKSDRVLLEFAFDGPDQSFSCYAYTSWQGHASLAFPKKNFTVRLYDDPEVTQKHKLVFKEWQNEHKYVLKANYRDPSQIRNLVATDVWADMADTRPNLYEPLRETSHFGAVDGFPVALYINDEFHGLYTLNLHIDDDLFGMNGKMDAIMIANASEDEETRFYEPAAFTDEKHAWEVEYCSTEDDDQWAKDKLNELIEFVMNSSDEEFQSNLNEYLDVDGAIDYLIFIYTMGLPESGAKDLVLVSYDNGIWIPSVYDMEHAFGLANDGTYAIKAEEFLPEKQEEEWNSATGSLLWDRLLSNYESKIRNRYRRLRKTFLTEEYLTDLIQNACAEIPQEYMEADLNLYERQSKVGDPEEQMTNYIRERLPLLDKALIGKELTEEDS